MNKPIHPNFFIPETFGDAVSYEVQVKYLHQRLKDLEEEGIPTPDLTELKQRVTTLETEVSAIQGEIEDLDLESITAQFEQINADIEQLQATQSQQGTTIQGYNTRLLDLETTTDLQDQAIDALDGRVTGVTTAVANVVAEQTQMAQDIAGKQDQLTAGANITIQNNVISASGGGGTIDIDTTVTANSQHAVTSEGIYNAIQTAKTAVETQHTTDINRIDGELAGKASAASVTTLRGDMEDEIERVEGDYQDADTALDTRLTAVETAQTTTEGNVTTLQQNVTTLQQTQTSQGTAIQGIRGRLDTAESNITQLQTNTSTLSGDVSSLQQTVSGKQDQLTAGQNITIQNNVISASGGGSSASVVRVDSESDYQTQKDNITSALAVKDVFSNSGMVSAPRIPSGVAPSDETAQFIVPYSDSGAPTFSREDAEIYVINRKQDEYQLKNGRGFTTTVGLNNHSVAISPNWDAPWIAVIDNESPRVSPPSMSMSGFPDSGRICRYIPVTTRVTDESYNRNIPAETYNKWFNINGRIMRGYAIYQADVTGFWPRKLLGIMWVDRSSSYSPSYDQSGDLISCYYECTMWDHIDDVVSSEDRNALVIVPIF